MRFRRPAPIPVIYDAVGELLGVGVGDVGGGDVGGGGVGGVGVGGWVCGGELLCGGVGVGEGADAAELLCTGDVGGVLFVGRVPPSGCWWPCRRCPYLGLAVC